MDPDERLAIIDALERKSTGTLRNYFAAQGYGQAFDRHGKSSKASRIAEALHDAAQDGRDEAILGHARGHFGISGPTSAKPTGANLLQRMNENQARRRVQSYPVSQAIDQEDLDDMSPPTPTTAFIVHGHDPRNYREIVARLIERSTDLEAVILDEQPNLGQHLLEKLKNYGRQNCVAIVIMTGDDQGRVATGTAEDDKPRARQNVVLELGYFIGKLPPERTIVLHEPAVEMPSDIDGVAYYSLGKDNWRDKLGKELDAIGIDVPVPHLTSTIPNTRQARCGRSNSRSTNLGRR